MLNDIFATSMRGEYVTRNGTAMVERGTWSYKGYGNAEITLQAHGESVEDYSSYVITIHSSERQLNYVQSSLRPKGEKVDHESGIEAEIAGYQVNLKSRDGSREVESLNVPDETIYDGTSPIWLIHMMLTALPPEDREIVAPVVFFDARRGVIQGGFYRLSRKELLVRIIVLNQEGETGETIEVEMADDACPRLIRNGHLATEIIRLPAS